MRRFTKAIAILVALAAAFLAGNWRKQQNPAQHAGNGRSRILYYVDPMHPAYKSDKPGIAPDCGMQLVPVQADSEGVDASSAGSPMPAGTVEISPERQQILGIRTEEIVKTSASDFVRVLGRVALDESRVFRVAAAGDGLVRGTSSTVTGNMVQKDEVLATFYNRDFLTAQQTYLYALNTMDRFKETENEDQLKLTRAQIRAAEENLEFLGMGPIQIREIRRTREIAKDVELRSPVTGLVVARNIFAGLRFERGTELFRIADVAHVWILADLFENETRYFPPGTKVRVLLPETEKLFQAEVSNALPRFDPDTRTLKLRLELDNPGYALQPDMFVDVELPVKMPPAFTVTADAVINSGRRKTVFVSVGDGLFEPRVVETGWSLGDRVQIVKGLKAGEHVVTSGTFLLDSESRLKPPGISRSRTNSGQQTSDRIWNGNRRTGGESTSVIGVAGRVQDTGYGMMHHKSIASAEQESR